MVEGYLMKAKNFFNEWFNNIDDNDYKIFIPENGKLLGYFKNKKLEFSEDKFYEEVDLKTLKKIDRKLEKGKFVCKVEINKTLLERLELSEEKLDGIKDIIRRSYKDLESSLRLP